MRPLTARWGPSGASCCSGAAFPVITMFIGGINLNHSQSWLVYGIVLPTVAYSIFVFFDIFSLIESLFQPLFSRFHPISSQFLLPVWYHDFLREGWSQSVQDMYCQALTDLGVFPQWGFPLRNHQFLIGVSIINRFIINHPAIRVTPSMETPKNAHLIIFYHVLWFSMLNHGAWFRVQICQWCW